ncbi:MAG: hypothetical protein DWH80_07995 [Planctomycetota bacterium]|nr:MAG: hypothetical protein DWH80_07995 [Planctomycetota bacterium]
MARQISQLAQVQRTVPHAKVAVPVNTAARMAGPVVLARSRENRQHVLQDKIWAEEERLALECHS